MKIRVALCAAIVLTALFAQGPLATRVTVTTPRVEHFTAASFSISSDPTGLVMVFVNGLLVTPSEYTRAGRTFSIKDRTLALSSVQVLYWGSSGATR